MSQQLAKNLNYCAKNSLASHVSESRAPIIKPLTDMASDVASEIETRNKNRPTRH